MVAYVVLQRDMLDALRAISPGMAVAIGAVSVVALVLQSFQFRAAILINGILMPLRESVALTAANTMANYYLPIRGGMVVRAAYMKRVYGFQISRYASVTVAITGLTIAMAGLLGVVGIGLVALGGGEPDQRGIVVFIGVAVAAVAAVAVTSIMSRLVGGNGRLASFVRTFRTGMALWLHDRRGLTIFLAWTFLFFGAQALRLWLAFLSVGVRVDFGSMLVIQAMAAVAFILALTPGNIGIKEGSIVFAASLLGVDPEIALLASLVDRSVTLIVTAAFGLFNTRFLSSRTSLGYRTDDS